MLPYILGGVVAVFLGAIALVATRPAKFRVVREIFIKAAPPVVFANVNNLRRWDDWSPWAKLDPNAKLTYSGPVEGKGASYTWTGNNKVGEGTLTITDSRPNTDLEMKLEFIRPFKCQNEVDFSFKPENGGTRVIWGMDGKNNFMSKAMCLFMNMDKMVGKDFERGLSSLQSLSESQK
jgi:hypothetical protein